MREFLDGFEAGAAIDATASVQVWNNGQPWATQPFNTSQSADLTGWATVSGTIGSVQRQFVHVLATASRVYWIGGDSIGAASSSVYTATINSDGTLSNIVSTTALPGALAGGHLIATKNRVYVAGGYAGASGSAAVNTVYTAPINPDGTLGSWTAATSLPGAKMWGGTVVTNNRVYLIGGSWTASVYTAPINSDGTLGNWATTTALPAMRSRTAVVKIGNRVYMLGGVYDNTNTDTNTIYYAPINEDGSLGAWVLDGRAMPDSYHSMKCVVTANRIYLLGGQYVAGQGKNNVYHAPINSDFSIGAWVNGTNLSSSIYDGSAVVTSSKIYLVGGWSGGASPTMVASFAGGANTYMDRFGAATDALPSLWDEIYNCTVADAVTTQSKGFASKGALNANYGYVAKMVTDRPSYYIALKVNHADNYSYDGLPIVVFMTSAGVVLGTVALYTDGRFTVNRGAANGTILGTATTRSITNTVYLIEAFYLPKTDATGRFILKINGIVEVDFTGQTSAVAAAIGKIRVGAGYNRHYYDDVVIDSSSWIGSTRIQALTPVAAGNSAQYTPSQGANYDCVDEIPPNDADYVVTNVAGKTDTYALGDLSGVIGSVRAVQVSVRANVQGVPATSSLKGVVRTGGADYASADAAALSTAIKSYGFIFEKDPATGEAWTESGVNALEAGFKSV